MELLLLRLMRLIIGLLLYALGIVCTVTSQLGLAPWDALHQGLSLVFPITFGQAGILVGLFMIIITFLFDEPLGIGTALNVLLIGSFIDILMSRKLIPYFPNLSYRFALLFLGMGIISIASWLYIGAGLGAGPRDGLMLTIMRKTGLPVSVARTIVEVSVAIGGYLLGGSLGIGTVMLFLFIGPIMGLCFRTVHFDPKNIDHRTICIHDITRKRARRNP